MQNKDTCLVVFSHVEFKIIFGSFREVCLAFAFPPEFNEKFFLSPDSAAIYMESLWPAARLMHDINSTGEETFPKECKVLPGGYTVYWDETSQAAIFRNSNEICLVYQPENGKMYYDALTEMPFTHIAASPLSILMQLSLFELEAMLAMITETYRILTEEWGVGEFHARFGIWPEEALKTMEKLRQEIETRKSRGSGSCPEPLYQMLGSRVTARDNYEEHSNDNVVQKQKVPKKNPVVVNFSNAEVQILFGSLCEVRHEMPDGYDETIGLPAGTSTTIYMYLRSAAWFMQTIHSIGEAGLPTEHKLLRDGCTAYCGALFTVIFQSPDKKYLAYQPENDKEFYDTLTEMPFSFDASTPLSIRMELTLLELEAMLTMVREIYKIVGEEFHARFGQPEEAQKLMKKLQNEIDTHKNSELRNPGDF